MTRGRRIAAWLVLLAALVLAIQGQRYLFYRPEYVWDGVVLHALGLAGFALAWRLAHPRAPGTRRRRRLPRGWALGRPAVTSLLALGLVLTAVATLLLRGRGLQDATGDAVVLWLLGVAAVLAAAFWPAAAKAATTNEGTQVRSNGFSRSRGFSHQILRALHVSVVQKELPWLELATVAGLTLLALILRVAALNHVPFTLGGDEAWHGLLARQVLHGQIRNPFQMGYMSMPTFFYWPLSWSLWLAGDNVVGLRLLAALVGTATVPLFYLFVRSRWGPRTALLATLFLAAYDYHVHYSRLGANNVWDPLFVLLALWAVDRGLAALADKDRRGRAGRRFLLAGLVIGFSAYFYTGARLLPPLVAAYVAFVAIKERGRLPGLGRHLVLLVVAALVTAGPMLDYALTHPDEWNARLNQVGILQSGWLAREPGLTGKTTAQILAEQFLRAAGAFHAFPDRTVWYGADRPLLGFLPGIFALLGMGWAVAHWRQRRYFLLLLWFWAVIITGGMLTESPPSSQRLVIAIPAVALLVAVGLEQVVRLAGRITVLDRRWRNGLLALSFGTLMFLAPRVEGHDVVEPLTAPPDFVDEGRGAVFLLLPARAGELAWIEQAYPEGDLREFYDDAGQLRFIAYTIAP
ncbi:MAG: glycosyltransferase family 39 protein [Anaerolineae bacterium]